MRLSLCELWQDERGSLLVTEWAFVATILMLGILCTATATLGRLHAFGGDERSETVLTGANPISSSGSTGTVD
jgi:hypothetical protein